MPMNFPNCCCQWNCSAYNQMPFQAMEPFISPKANFCKCTSFTPRGFFPNGKMFLVCCNECVIRTPKDAARVYKASSSSLSSTGEDCSCCNKCAVCMLKRYCGATQRKPRRDKYENRCSDECPLKNRRDHIDERYDRSKRSRYKDKGHCQCLCRRKSENNIDNNDSSLEESKPRRKSHQRKRTVYKDMSEYEQDSPETRSLNTAKKQPKIISKHGDRVSKSILRKVVEPLTDFRTKEKSGKVKISNVRSRTKLPAKKPPIERKEKVRIADQIGDVIYPKSKRIYVPSRRIDGSSKRIDSSSKRIDHPVESNDWQPSKKVGNGRQQNAADALRIRLEQNDQLRFQKEKPSSNGCTICQCQQKMYKLC